MDFNSGVVGVMRWLEKPPDPSAVTAQEQKNKGHALRHDVGVA